MTQSLFPVSWSRPDVLEGRLSGQDMTLAVLLEQAFRIREEVAAGLQSTQGSLQVEARSRKLLENHILTITRIVKQLSLDIQVYKWVWWNLTGRLLLHPVALPFNWKRLKRLMWIKICVDSCLVFCSFIYQPVAHLLVCFDGQHTPGHTRSGSLTNTQLIWLHLIEWCSARAEPAWLLISISSWTFCLYKHKTNNVHCMWFDKFCHVLHLPLKCDWNEHLESS